MEEEKDSPETYYCEDFFDMYGWVSCYECDIIFTNIEELTKHQEECC
jgi:hypothetical protein|tara:strand:+ start:640 stop:780 length:141 start_codon:yes stop_codon:yes gene_type:complete